MASLIKNEKHRLINTKGSEGARRSHWYPMVLFQFHLQVSIKNSASNSKETYESNSQIAIVFLLLCKAYFPSWNVSNSASRHTLWWYSYLPCVLTGCNRLATHLNIQRCHSEFWPKMCQDISQNLVLLVRMNLADFFWHPWHINSG